MQDRPGELQQLVFSAQKLDSGMGSIRQGTSISSVSSVGSYSFQVIKAARLPLLKPQLATHYKYLLALINTGTGTCFHF